MRFLEEVGNGGRSMFKVLGSAIGIVFLIGLLVIIGLLALIF